MDCLWAFLNDPNNREILTWIGGGVVIVVGGLWAVFKFFQKSGKEQQSSIHVKADRGGVAAGRDANVMSNESEPKMK